MAAAANDAGSEKTRGSRFGTLKAGAEPAGAQKLSRSNRIVRRKAGGQPIVSDEVHTRSMSKSTVAIVAVAALGFTAGAVYWARGRAAAPKYPGAASSTVAASGSSSMPETSRAAAGKPASSAALPPATPDTGGPLRSGEVLEFAADVAKLSNVANLRLQIRERRNFFGKTAWHLQASAHTENPLRMVFELDDQFDSYSDAGTLSSLQYEMHLNERGEKVDSIQRMSSSGAEPAGENATQTRVLPGTRDPLGMMEYLRIVDWSKLREVRSPVYDGHKLYDVRAALAGSSESVTVPAGSFTASKIDIHVFDGGTELKDAHFTLHLANNSFRTPVLLEAVMPFAAARVELVKAK